jgi:hypothetical protein
MDTKKLTTKQIGEMIAGEYSLTSKFPYGYRNREDITNLPAGVLVKGSKNVLTNVSERIQARKGYTLDGAGSSTFASILSSYTWDTSTMFSTSDAIKNINNRKTSRENNLRAYPNSTTTGMLQFRYDNGTSVTWNTLKSDMASANINFSEFLDTTEKLQVLLFVDGSPNIYEWSGGVVEVDSVIGASSSIIATVNSTPTAAGTGYTVGDILTISGGNLGAVIVTSISGGNPTGPVTGVQLVSSGSGGYATGAGKATTGGTGTSCTIEILTLGTGSSIVKKGTSTWAEEGFYHNNNKVVTIRGIDYTYTGGDLSTTLTGITPDPTAQVPAAIPQAGDLAIQKVIKTTNTAAGLALLNNDLIATQYNYVYIGSRSYSVFYQSNLSNYKLWTYSAIRKVGEGCMFTLDAAPTGFIPREDTISVSAGKSLWYDITIAQSADLLTETRTATRLKTNDRQSAQSQALISKFKNNVVFISNEPTMDSLGRVENIYGTVQTTNMSDPIKLDFDTYDFTDGSMFYNRYFIYVAVPREGLVLIYNLVRKYWEAPQTLPISRFYTVNGDLYGHSYNTPESYKLFTGPSDNGHPIESVCDFSFQSFGQRWAIKQFNKFYVEGYISSNTELDLNLNYDLDGWQKKTSYPIIGTDTKIVAIRSAGGSLGSSSLGKNPLGSTSNVMNPNQLPPKFRVIKTFPSSNFWEYQTEFRSIGVDQDWEIIAFGPAVQVGPTQSNEITE